MLIAVLGNCQVRGLADALELYLPGSRANAYHLTTDPTQLPSALATALARPIDLCFVHDSLLTIVGRDASLAGMLPAGVVMVPTITFSAFQPDIQYLFAGGRVVKNGLNGDWNSRLIAWAFCNGLSRREARALFRHDVFEALGYLDGWAPAVRALRLTFETAGLEFTPWIRKVQRTGVFMHGLNHPVPSAMAAIAAQVARREGAASFRDVPGVEQYLSDHLSHIVWPVYPDIARALGLTGTYLWRDCDRYADLDQFIERTYANWEADDFRRGDYHIVPALSSEDERVLAGLVR